LEEASSREEAYKYLPSFVLREFVRMAWDLGIDMAMMPEIFSVGFAMVCLSAV
jgi:hypothetical protein